MHPQSLDQENTYSPPRYSYGALLFFLVVMITCVPVLREQSESSVVMELGITGVLLFSVYSLSYLPRVRWWAFSLALITVIENWILHVHFSKALYLAAYLCNLGFFLLVIAVIASNIFRSRRVDINVILGAICIYLLACIAWALAYGLVEGLYPGSFYLNGSPIAHPMDVLRVRVLLSDFIYFSIVTFTTLGYGDFLPFTSLTRILAALEAVSGQLYVAIVLARLMGIYLQNTATKNII